MENIIYKTEDEYKKDIVNALEKDFILIPEAKIVWPHPAIKGRKADFIIHPKEHLVKNGFDAGIIAIEVKSPICKNGESVKKILNGFYQAHSYALCQYNDSHIDFALLYPSVQLFFDYEFQQKYNYDERQKYSQREVSLLHRMMQRANVGTLKISKNSYLISFAGSRFYSPEKGRSKIKNLGMVRRVGSQKIPLN